jgi:ketosteroid isomerase-like protein
MPDGMLAGFADNVAFLRDGVPAVYGLDAARAVLNGGVAHGRAAAAGIVSWEPLGGGVSDDLRSGYTFGITARTGTGTPTIRIERYLAYWERERGQPWRIVAYAEIGASAISPSAVSLAASQTTPIMRALPKPLAEARENVRAADSLFSDLSYRMGTAYAFSNTVADDGVLFGAPSLLIGPKAIREAYEARGETSLTWTPVYAGIAGSRDLGFTIGEYISTGRGPSGAAVQRVGKYLTVWKKQKDGSWRYVADGGNASPSRDPR